MIIAVFSTPIIVLVYIGEIMYYFCYVQEIFNLPFTRTIHIILLVHDFSFSLSLSGEPMSFMILRN